MRIFVKPPSRIGNPHLPKRFLGDRIRLLCIHMLMQHHCFHDLIANRVNRIERCHRLLENHRDVFAANLAHLLFRQGQKITAIEHDPPGQNLARRRGNQP